MLLGAWAVPSERATAAAADAVSVSMVQLLANPERFEGQRVRVQGFCRLAFEEQALYFHKEDSDMASSENGVWLRLDRGDSGLSDKFVIVEGTFTARAHGHLGMWPGEIQSITRFVRVKSREEQRKLMKKGPPRPTSDTPIL